MKHNYVKILALDEIYEPLVCYIVLYYRSYMNQIDHCKIVYSSYNYHN